MKIVINKCYGGFSISKKAQELLKASSAYTYKDHSRRTDPDLIKVVEELGEDADGLCAELKVIEIPDNVEYVIEEYDGIEWVSEKHRTWD